MDKERGKKVLKYFQDWEPFWVKYDPIEYQIKCPIRFVVIFKLLIPLVVSVATCLVTLWRVGL